MSSVRTTVRAVATALLVFMVFQSAPRFRPDLPERLGQAAAHVAGWVTGTPFLEHGLEHPALRIDVVPACGGWDFLSMLAALLVGRCMYARPRRRALAVQLCAVIPIALFITIAANAARFVVVLTGNILLAPHMPDVALSAFHTALGVGIFLPVLIVTYLLWEKVTRHEFQSA